MVLVAPEGHLVTGLDAESVPQLLGDHDLALGTDTVSHTTKYNFDPLHERVPWHRRTGWQRLATIGLDGSSMNRK
ncbi:MAG: hypothetical protein QOI99_57 [Actinomycetota bacterium]|nr:hypothetical protein [Actinomycetota bacterium]